MKQHNKGLWIIVVAAVLVGALFGASFYYFISAGKNSPVMTSSYVTPVSTTSSVIVGVVATSSSSTIPGPVTASSMTGTSPAPVDMSDWKTYLNYELGFSIQYPPDLTVDTSNPSVLSLTFPSSYFSTEMADSDTFSVTISASCTPETSFSVALASIPSQTAVINGMSFIKNTQSGVGAGNYDNATIYQANTNDVCYMIEFHSHAPDSGGDYTSDPTQITSLEAAHASDEANINDIVSNILSTFTFVNTGAGENEADYASQQQSGNSPASPAVQQPGISASNVSGSINLASVSTTTTSVGSSIVLTGSGFSGGVTNVVISNGSVTGILWNGVSSSDSILSVTLPAQVCTQNVPAGAACPAYLILNPGIYTVSVANQNGTTQAQYIRLQ